jgi:hypothetical protein
MRCCTSGMEAGSRRDGSREVFFWALGLHPEFTLVHEIIFHAYAGLLDNAVFGNTYFQQQGLWRPGNSTATVNISTWMSTDCTCTPGNPQAPTCQANTAQW